MGPLATDLESWHFTAEQRGLLAGVWLCFMHLFWCAELLAESVVWRGCRHDGRPIPAAKGVEYLNAGLEAEGRRAVRHLAAAAMPLPIPLPFPRVFGRGVTADGDRVRDPY